MSMQPSPVVLEAQMRQFTAAMRPDAGAPGAALDAVGQQARAALRGLDTAAPRQERERLGRTASRLARRLMQQRSAAAMLVDATALEHAVCRLGIERGRPLDRHLVAVTVRRTLDGRAELLTAVNTVGKTVGNSDGKTPDSGNNADEPAEALSILFTQIALVAALARALAP